MPTGEDAEHKILAQSLISAAARHDITAVNNLLKKVSANVQRDSDGYTPLHAAIAASESKNSNEINDSDAEVAKIAQLLFESGAIWNDLDKNDETPGCIAYRLGLKQVYQAIVDAGIRAELLLTKLDKVDDLDEVEDETTETEDASASARDAEKLAETGSSAAAPASDATTAGTATVDGEYPPPDDYIDHWGSNNAFLRSSLRYTDTTLLDHSSNAVMMDWETEIMTRHAATLLATKGLRAMNIGHGMGIVDTAIQAHGPAEHHIVEAHPEVLQQMRAKGWFEKPGVFIHEGRWQDILPKLAEQGVLLDAVYYDTFAEDYKDLRELFSEHVVNLLDQSGRFSFYNGMGADRRVCYDVYTGVVEIDLTEAGFATTWENIPVPQVDWKGVRRPYWNVDVYRLPICTFA